MELDRDDIAKVAQLARLEFSQNELEQFAKQLGKIVTFVELLNEVDTKGVEPLAHAMDLHSILRPDELREGLSREAALSNSPNQDGECFLVPPVMARHQ